MFVGKEKMLTCLLKLISFSITTTVQILISDFIFYCFSLKVVRRMFFEETFEVPTSHPPKVGMKSLQNLGDFRNLLRTCTSVATRCCTFRVNRSKRSISRNSNSCRSLSSFTSPSDSTGFYYQNSVKITPTPHSTKTSLQRI